MSKNTSTKACSNATEISNGISICICNLRPNTYARSASAAANRSCNSNISMPIDY